MQGPVRVERLSSRDAIASERASAGPLAALAASVRRRLVRWCERTRERRALAALDDWLLKDMGVSRSDAMRECDKAFWRE